MQTQNPSPNQRLRTAVLVAGTGLVLLMTSLHFGSLRFPLPIGSQVATRPLANRMPVTPAEEPSSDKSPARADASPAPALNQAAKNRHPQGRLPHGSSVRFNGQTLGSDAGASARLLRLQTDLPITESQVVLLGFNQPLTPEQKQNLREVGISLLAPVPDQGWIARVQGRYGQSTAELTLVDLLEPLTPLQRIRSTLRQSSDDPDVPIYLHVVPDRGPMALRKALAENGFDDLTVQITPSHSYLAGPISHPRLEAFLQIVGHHPDVQWVERGLRAQSLNQSARRTLQSGNFLGPTPFWQAGLYGSNQIIAVCDTGIDLDSCYFRDTFDRWPPTNALGQIGVDLSQRKVVAVDFLYPGDKPTLATGWDNQGHGTAVAGCAAGSDLNSPWDPEIPNGMAPGAKLIIQDAGFTGTDVCADLIGLGCPVTNYLAILLQAQAQGATIHNNSWGDREDAIDQNTYSQPARELDQTTWAHPEFLVVCAGGNSALSDTIGSPSIAKNALSVAATQSGSAQERIAFFSSRGWASDGRFKPDLAAPGQSIRTPGSDGDISTRNCTATSVSGTSFSSPLIAGMAALVRDYFAQGFYPDGSPSPLRARTNISAALVKAVLIHSTVPMLQAAAPPPSRDQGWGRVNLARALPLANGATRLLAIDATNGFETVRSLPRLTYLRARSQTSIKVTLVWSDYPATPGADKHLVNDLDLRLKSRSREFRGNSWEQGASIPGGEFDHSNNVEQILISAAAGETFELSIWSHLVLEGPQPFAVVATGDFEEIPLDRDTDQDGLPDGWELWQQNNLSLEPALDTDGDGTDNLTEFAANTDPLNAESHPSLEIAALEAAQIHLRFPVSEGRSYVIEELVISKQSQPPGAFPDEWRWDPRTTELIVGRPAEETIYELALDRELPGQPSSITEGRLYRVRIGRSSVLLR